jgi:hypothetical protein
VGPFVGPLMLAGLRVVTLDAPGHGDCGPGVYGPGRTLLPDMITALCVAANSTLGASAERKPEPCWVPKPVIPLDLHRHGLP